MLGREPKWGEQGEEGRVERNRKDEDDEAGMGSFYLTRKYLTFFFLKSLRRTS